MKAARYSEQKFEIALASVIKGVSKKDSLSILTNIETLY